jgi:D-serine deaminase-like pyridoxal phosphate-dependent protein
MFTADRPLTVLVECDTGTMRCGVQTPAQALALARQIGMAPGLRFGGLMTYPPARKPEQAEAWLREAIDLLTQAGMAVPKVTSGNTPDMWRTGQSVVTERRPGTYIYYDRMQVAAGAASWDDCALTVLATVVSRPTATRIVLDSGSKSLSSDIGNLEGYGILQGTDITLKYLNEEHGVIELSAPADTPRIGERVRIVPNHVCVVSNLFDVVNLVQGETVVDTVPVAARGRVD